MSRTITWQRLDYGVWRATWAAATAPYRIYRDGVLIESAQYDEELQDDATTEQTEWLFVEADTIAPPNVEVLSSTDGEAVSVRYPSRLTLQWRGHEDDDEYVIEQYESAAWAEVARVLGDGERYYRYETLSQDDGSTAQFRVQARDARGTESLRAAMTVEHVCIPAPPTFTMTWASTGSTGELTFTVTT
jgi:hypothetical protein